MKKPLLFLFIPFLFTAFYFAGPEKKKGEPADDYNIEPVLFTSVNLTDQFWAPRIKTNHDVTIPFTVNKLFETERIKNFEIAAGLKSGEFCTTYTFDDTDVYKILEGMAYSYQIFNDSALDAKMDSLISIVAAAQEPDGYIFTNRTIMGANGHEWSGSERWEKVHDLSHELYNIGHLIEAGVAHYRATGKKSLLNVTKKAADRVSEDFGPGKIERYPGHQVIELALAKLYRATGDEKYLETAKFLLDVRGPGGDEYNQAHKKVVDQTEAVGHAVRAAYMYAGMADVAALTREPAYINAIDKIWEDVVNGKLYVTGGIGSTGNIEGFGPAFHLPNLSAYNETCASIANVYWNYRQFLLHGESKYFDVLERTLYNSFLSGISLEGNRFFYPNPLESHGQHSRSPWFNCACCPGNVTRFVPSVGGYFYAKQDKSIFINLFAENTTNINLKGTSITLEQKTEYPWKGDVEITVSPEETTEFTLNVRIPGWVQNKPVPSDLYFFADNRDTHPKAYLNGEEIALDLENGYLSLEREWNAGDKIRLELPMEERVVKAHEKVEADQGKIAIQRGPIVFTSEWPDNGGEVINLMADKEFDIHGSYQSDMLHGIYTVQLDGYHTRQTKEGRIQKDPTTINLIPYYAWAHRGSGEMSVWLANDMKAARPSPAPTIASESKVTSSSKTQGLNALNDQMEPEHSNDRSVTYFHWWPMADTLQWVQYDFEQPEEVSSSKVFWFDDGPHGGCRIPEAWKLLYKKEGQWIPVETVSGYSIVKDSWSEVTFEPITTSALRMEITFPKEYSTGIMEWKVK